MKKVRVAILTVIMLVTIAMGGMVKATDFSCTVKLTSNDMAIKNGETITLNLKIDNLVLSDNSPGITLAYAVIDYDKAIFENVNGSNLGGKVRTITYNSDTQRIRAAYSKNEWITEDGSTMFTITMKVKENAPEFGSTTIKLSKIAITDYNQDVKIDSATITLKQEKEVIQTPAPIVKPVEAAKPEVKVEEVKASEVVTKTVEETVAVKETTVQAKKEVSKIETSVEETNSAKLAWAMSKIKNIEMDKIMSIAPTAILGGIVIINIPVAMFM